MQVRTAPSTTLQKIVNVVKPLGDFSLPVFFNCKNLNALSMSAVDNNTVKRLDRLATARKGT
jgi:hypothetical protein